ncbi:MAG: V-type ATP synthase subunit F [Oscillospiraceae bacterium]|nr:V-type ATP synthase subunit F [Oscillospiraceae bacterium]
MHKIAVVGGRETVIGFKALGLDVFPVTDVKQAGEVLKTVTKPEEGYAVIYIEENTAQGLGEEISRFKDSPIPAIILIPGRDGPLGLGQSALKAAVERAVGTDIL